VVEVNQVEGRIFGSLAFEGTPKFLLQGGQGGRRRGKGIPGMLLPNVAQAAGWQCLSGQVNSHNRIPETIMTPAYPKVAILCGYCFTAQGVFRGIGGSLHGRIISFGTI
jgi:hypothetical protein